MTTDPERAALAARLTDEQVAELETHRKIAEQLGSGGRIELPSDVFLALLAAHEVVVEMTRDHPDLAQEGLDHWRGYYADWDEIISAIPEDIRRDGYGNGPTEMIARLTDQRDDAHAENKRLREALENMHDEVPKSWLDPILTGPHAMKVEAPNRQVEDLLNEIRARIAQKARTALRPDAGEGVG